MDTQVILFRDAMPRMLDHAGTWIGTYTHLDAEARIIDRHASRVVCEFPETGPHPYIQHNTFTWDDGREVTATLPGTFRDGRLWWDTETFSGSAWESHDGFILLNLDRKDEPGTRFHEIILMGEGGRHRTRTWHWLKDGRLIRRTLCEEARV